MNLAWKGWAKLGNEYGRSPGQPSKFVNIFVLQKSSYDIVKRFFVENLIAIGYEVLVDPMLTGDWNGLEHGFYRFLNAKAESDPTGGKTALLLDPDTGIGNRKTKRHVTISEVAVKLRQHEIVFIFDQAFSRAEDSFERIKSKLAALRATGNFGFYYDSHARFLFAANSRRALQSVEKQILSSGLPASRLVKA